MLSQTEAAAGAGVAFALTLGGQWLLQPFAQRLGLLDTPNARKDHATPTPVTGGIAMMAGVILTGIFMLGDLGPASRGFALSALILIVLGLFDDKYDLSWRIRIAVQTIATLVMIYVGGIRVEQFGDVFGLNVTSLGALSVPFTIFATLGIINAINMIDGADGLAGLLVFCALVMLDAAAIYVGNDTVYTRVPILIGAIAGFLVYNLRLPWRPRARIFMGNAGSAFLGLIVASFMFRLTQTAEHPVSPILAVWLVPIPIVDCLALILHRIRRRCSPFSADHNHVHHLMLDGGFGPTEAALSLAAFSCACGLIAGMSLRAHVPRPVLLISFVVLCASWFWLTLHRPRAVRFFRRIYCMTFLHWRGVEFPPRPMGNSVEKQGT